MNPSVAMHCMRCGGYLGNPPGSYTVGDSQSPSMPVAHKPICPPPGLFGGVPLQEHSGANPPPPPPPSSVAKHPSCAWSVDFADPALAKLGAGGLRTPHVAFNLSQTVGADFYHNAPGFDPDGDPSDSDDTSSDSDDDEGDHHGGPSAPGGGDGGGDGNGGDGNGGDGLGEPDGFGYLNDIYGPPEPPPGVDAGELHDEDKAYKSRNLSLLTLPKLPSDATENKAWDLSSAASFAGIDNSPNDVLTKWFLAATAVTGELHEVIPYFHHNSNGLHLLDRYVGKLLATPENLTHRIFGCQLAAYVEWCHNQHTSPKGRVMIAIKSLRFRIARTRGKQLTLIHLLDIQLASFKLADVRAFVDRVRLCLVNLRPNEIKDDDLMFTWLWEKFKLWSPISRKLEKIRIAKEGSRRRTWVYLWTAITNFLDNYHEDENHANLMSSIKGNKIAGASAKSKSEKAKIKAEKKARQKEIDDAVTSAVNAAAAKFGKGKGKANPKPPGKGKGDKSPKPPGPPPANPNQAAIDAARAKPPKERSLQEKALLPCVYFCKGLCKHGKLCHYSHKDKDCKALKAKFANADNKTASATPAVQGKDGKPPPKGPKAPP